MNGSGSKGQGCEWPCSTSRLPASHKAPFIAWKYCQNRAADFHVILQTWAKTGDEDVSKHLQKTEAEKLDYDAISSSD